MIWYNNQPVIILSHLRERSFGLLNSKLAQNGEYVLLINCNSVHTFGMKSPIEVIFIDSQGQALKVIESLSPNRIVRCRKAKHTLERRI